MIAVSNSAGVETRATTYPPYGGGVVRDGVCGSVKAGQSRRFTGKGATRRQGWTTSGRGILLSKVGRFTTVDPAYTWKENLVDPQRWNRYAYVRNNPSRRRSGREGDQRHRTAEQCAVSAVEERPYLSRPGAKSQWNALNDDPGITVNMAWDARGSTSVTGGYVWDASGNLTSVDVTLAAKTGEPGEPDERGGGYVYGSQITDGGEAFVCHCARVCAC